MPLLALVTSGLGITENKIAPRGIGNISLEVLYGFTSLQRLE